MKKALFFFTFLSVVLGSGFAATVGFSCVQNTNTADAVKITAAIEAELFELAFDYGIIATSTEYSLRGYEYYNSNALLTQAFESSTDYLVVVYCEYEAGRTETQMPVIWKKLEWKLFDFSSHTVLVSEEIPLDHIDEPDFMKKARLAGKKIGQRVLQHISPAR
ncbi:MAG: hypothetical protein ACTTH7_09965 [Treponema sp.]